LKIFNHILLFTAAVIILLHSFVPHEHHDEMGAELHQVEHENTDNFLGWIKTIFHNDLGEDHLENYEHLDGDLSEFGNGAIPLVICPAVIWTALSEDNAYLGGKISTSIIKVPPLIRYRSAIGLRGPPQFS